MMLRSILLSLLMYPSVFLFAQEPDTLRMNNGFVAIGEIVGLKDGEIQLKTSLFGTVNADLDDIGAITSSTFLDIITTGGDTFFARISPGAETGRIVLHTGLDTVEIAITELYSIITIKQDVLSRLSGTFSAGLNFTKATENLQINWGFDVAYRSYANRHSLTYDGLYTENVSGAFRRQNLVYNYNRYLSKGWFLYGAAETQSNTQLQLRVRGQAAFGGGKNFFQDRNKLLAVILALNSNNEIPLEGDGFSSMEGLVGYRFRYTNLMNGKMDITSNLSYFRAITNTSRERIDFDFRVSWKIYGDFALTASYFNNYDSRVVQTGESRNDYTIILAASYKL